MNASPAVRSLRAAVFAALCVLLAAAGHGLATGDPPPLSADGAGFLAVFAAGWLLGARERSLPGIGAAMLTTQAGLHVAFDAARARTTAQTMPAMSPMNMTSAPGMHLHHLQPLHTHTATAAHVLAALAASWWLRRGEAALWSLLRWAVAFLPGLAAWWRDTPAPPPVPALPPAAPAPAPAPPRRSLLRHAVSRRGPPAPIPYAI
ncbi:hypothetical protein SAMN04487983_1003200 [Streptomyces sp. yr375]|uniref:hypothetical protein n=1 Tax=Streptomyces sp. yr375 TaxID=1761906 RepID=UPI0008B0C270|nr:hypothetical protein [Streptomyces sp. yr375]SEQ15672.1 hypothetical protein SAMN04487983_1003200 [Streptomyces sp. yr375]